MNPAYLGVPFVFTWNQHALYHSASVDRFLLIGNRRLIPARSLVKIPIRFWGEWPIGGESARPSFGGGGPSEKLRLISGSYTLSLHSRAVEAGGFLN